MALEAIKTKMQELNDAVKAFGKEELAKEFRAIFDAHPTLEAIRWHQYTPHFNDGDACVFSMGDMCFKLTTDKEEDDEDNDWEKGYGPYRYGDGLSDTEKAIKEALSAFQGEAVERVMLATFDDHKLITATRAGFEVEDYDHD